MEIETFRPKSKVLLDVMNGLGFPTKNIILLFAKYGSGKSSLLLDLVYDFYKQKGKKALWIDTEGGMDIYIALNKPMLERKYGVEGEPIILRKIVDLKELFTFFGMDVEFEISDSGMTTIKYIGEAMIKDPNDRRKKIPYSEAQDLIEKEDVGMIVIDSITMPFKAKFTGGREQLPGRSSAYGLLLAKLNTLTDKYNLITFITAHESLTPGGYDKPTAVGASTLKYMSKFWLYLEKPAFTNPRMTGFRRVYLVRFPNANDWSRKGVLEFTENGVVDSSEDEIEERRKEIQREKREGR